MGFHLLGSHSLPRSVEIPRSHRRRDSFQGHLRRLWVMDRLDSHRACFDCSGTLWLPSQAIHILTIVNSSTRPSSHWMPRHSLSRILLCLSSSSFTLLAISGSVASGWALRISMSTQDGGKLIGMLIMRRRQSWQMDLRGRGFCISCFRCVFRRVGGKVFGQSMRLVSALVVRWCLEYVTTFNEWFERLERHVFQAIRTSVVTQTLHALDEKHVRARSKHYHRGAFWTAS